MSGRKTILLTGCNSGIGLLACRKLFADTKRVKSLILVARNSEKAEWTKNELSRKSTTNDATTESVELIPLACDMSSFDSIRKFSNELHTLMKERDSTIDVLCLNAGMFAPRNAPAKLLSPDSTDTSKRYEQTFVTNHLGTFFLEQNVQDLITRNGGRIVITTSGLHSMERNGYTPNFDGFKGVLNQDNTLKTEIVTLNDRPYNYMEVYSISKLCNATFTTELNRRLSELGITANCFCPGFIPSTGLARNENFLAVKALSFYATRVAKFAETEEWGSGALVYMALEDETGLKGGQYWKGPRGVSLQGGTHSKDFKPIDMNPEALKEDNMTQLWELSLKLCNLEK